MTEIKKIESLKKTDSAVSGQGREILLLVRTFDNNEAADQAFGLLKITAEGCAEIKKIGAMIDNFKTLNSEFSSANFHLPNGVDFYLLTDTADEHLESLFTNEMLKTAEFSVCLENVELTFLDRVRDHESVVLLEAVGDESLLQLANSLTPNFSIDCQLMRFYDGAEFRIYCPFKYDDGAYSVDSILIETIEELFGAE